MLNTSLSSILKPRGKHDLLSPRQNSKRHTHREGWRTTPPCIAVLHSLLQESTRVRALTFGFVPAASAWENEIQQSPKQAEAFCASPRLDRGWDLQWTAPLPMTLKLCASLKWQVGTLSNHVGSGKFSHASLHWHLDSSSNSRFLGRFPMPLSPRDFKSSSFFPVLSEFSSPFPKYSFPFKVHEQHLR